MNRSFTIASLALIALAAAGCARNEAAEAPPAPPQVSVARVIERPITEFDEFTGRFAAVDRVELRPRVSGYISSINFTEGHEVRKGDVLFVIDPRPYEAEFKRAEAELARARTQLNLAQSEHVRAQSLLEARAISKEEFEARVSSTEQATANVQAADAALDAAKLNLIYTRVQAPIAGLISRAEVTAGNLVTSDQTLLTTLVSIDPIYVEFEGDEQVYLKYAALARAGLRPSSRDSQNPVWVGLADEQDSPHRGVMVFVDNELNPATGTIRARGRFDNHDRRFTPGMFARVKLVGSGQYTALLINDSAVSTDQSVKYVLAVTPNNRVEYRAVKLGPVVDGLRVVRDGLAPGASRPGPLIIEAPDTTIVVPPGWRLGVDTGGVIVLERAHA